MCIFPLYDGHLFADTCGRNNYICRNELWAKIYSHHLYPASNVELTTSAFLCIYMSEGKLRRRQHTTAWRQYECSVHA
jgi:hypothetical protein